MRESFLAGSKEQKMCVFISFTVLDIENGYCATMFSYLVCVSSGWIYLYDL
jgi:hypothetical protein